MMMVKRMTEDRQRCVVDIDATIQTGEEQPYKLGKDEYGGRIHTCTDSNAHCTLLGKRVYEDL